MQVGANGQLPELADRGRIGRTQERDAVPVDLEGLREAEASDAGRQDAREIGQDGLRLARGRTDGDVELLPRAIRDLGFKDREGEPEIRTVRRRDVGHATAEAEPSVEQEDKGFVDGDGAEVEDHAVGFG